MMSERTESALREMPFMGVIRVVVEAMKLGYHAEDPNWSNLGQGQPEVGVLDGAPPRYDTIHIPVTDNAYGPVEGLPELRERVAEHYNRLYRQGKSSKYTPENVVIAAGGRTALTRAVAALDGVRVGYFIPDYTAYEDMLSAFRMFTPVLAFDTTPTDFCVDLGDLDGRVEAEKLRALLISNPCNPTGRAIVGDELAGWVELANRRNCTLLLDEFYSHYVWTDGQAGGGPISAAKYVEDVNKDPVILFDGLTKNYRYPGWRLGWAVGPREVIRNVTAAGSFVDGGPPRPIQRAAVDVLEPSRADQETDTVRRVFAEKRRVTVEQLREVGVEFPLEPEGTFYAYGSVRKLPAPLNDGIGFYERALRHNVLTVPGEFFDVNPHKSRKGRSPMAGWVRFSFGPPMDNLKAGLQRLQAMIRAAG